MRFLLMLGALGGALMAQLAEGPGMAETARTCKGCHEVERSISLRQDKDGWATTLTKMVGLGMKASDADLAIINEYLARNYPADAIAPVNINKAGAIELESRLSLRRSHAAALLAYRAKHGPFKTLNEVKQVPGIDAQKLEAKRAMIVFQ